MAAPPTPRARIAVVGAGINGTMTAWALAERGHAVVLFDRGEPMAETSARSSRMLHGGLRYLAKLRIGMVREALHERSWWRRQNTGLVREFRAHIPVRRGDLRTFLLFGAGVALYHLLAIGSGFEGSRWVGRRTLAERFPDLDTESLVGAWSYTDALMDDAGLGRWAVETLAKRGVEVRAHTPVAAVAADTVTLEDGTRLPFDAVVNATGPWTERLAATGLAPGERAETGLMLVRGSHLLVRRSLEHAVVLPHVDGRILFFLPWSSDTAILGTTDARQESPDTAEISEDERAELIAAHARWFRAALPDHDISGAYSGLRPLVRSDTGTSGASREAVLGTPGGVVTVYGGKWTTSRRLGQKVADLVEKRLGGA
ncbi:MAG: FAD-dependent oxidoreductase [Armatimonadota bacterium]